jgi:DNA-binding NarL/FixJ family response regulator
VSSSRLSVIVVDDHPLVRAGIEQMLSAERLYKLIAVAETGVECIELLRRFRPAVAVVDISVSQPGPAQVLREVKLNHWQTRICFLTEDQIPPDVLEAGRSGAAFFADERSPVDLRDRLREIATDIIGKTSATANGLPAIKRPTSAPSSERHLTARQKQIVAMLKLGASNREIARVLGVTEGTVKVHLHRIFKRIGVTNRTHLAAQSFPS